MTTKSKTPFTVIENEDYKQIENKNVTPPNMAHTNPMYEKLLQFKQDQKKKRFTVEDLLKW